MSIYQGATVLVNVSAAHNNGQHLAPAVVTAVNEDGTVNVRVLYDAPPPAPGFGHRHRPEWLEGVTFYDTTDPASANREGRYGAFWPDAPQQQDLSVIQQEVEKIMSVQSDVDNAATALQGVTADLGTVASALQAVAANLGTVATSVQAEIVALNAQIAASGGTPVDTSALNAQVAALQQAQPAVDAAVTALQQAQAAVDALEPAPAPAPVAAPAAEGTAGSTVAAGDGGSAA